MTDEYTPTTDEVIDGYTQMRAREVTPEERILVAMDGLAELERWLEGEREAVRQELRERIAQDIARAVGEGTASDIARGTTR